MATFAAEADAKNTSDPDPETVKICLSSICLIKRQERKFIVISSAEPTMINAEHALF